MNKILKSIIFGIVCLVTIFQGGMAQAITQSAINSIANNTPFYDPSEVSGGSSCSDSASSSIALTGADNQAKIMNYLVSKGMKPFQAAGAVGNLMWESGGLLDPAALEDHGSGTPGYTGHGIVQWSKDRWRTDYGPYVSGGFTATVDAARTSDLTDFAPYPVKPPLDPNTLLGYAAKNNTKWQDLGTQAAFMWEEISPGGNRSTVLATMEATTDYTSAATVWFNDYESPGDSTLPNRIKDASDALTAYGGGGGTTTTTPATGTTTPTAGTCTAATTCTGGSGTTTVNLSPTRQTAICLAQQELATKWTPLPAVPRMGYLVYTDGAKEEWCADFVSWIYKQAGYPFSGGTSGGWRLPAVDQIEQLGKLNSTFHWHDAAGYTPKPGDLAIHKNAANSVSHVNMVISVSGTVISLIGGDQGSGPYGGDNSASILSQVTQQSSTDSDTIGYVSPD